MTTIKEVSKYADVSPSTVSRVLNGTAVVNDETKKRVLEAIDTLKYQPNAFARGLATNRSGGIGVVINDFISPYYANIVHGIEKVIEENGMHLIVSSGHANAHSERCAVENLRQRRADALILHLEEISDYELLGWLEQDEFQSIPLILVGRYVAEIQDYCVQLDNEYGGHLATQHLIENGHRKIAHITGRMEMKDARDRLQGYRRALEEASIEFDDDYVVESKFTVESGQMAMKRLLDRNLDITAVFIGNDEMAAGALQVLRAANIQVPQEISIVGYDDILIGRLLYPALTTVQQPLNDMGEAAAKLALAELFNKEEEVRRSFEPKLIHRQSVRDLRSG